MEDKYKDHLRFLEEIEKKIQENPVRNPEIIICEKPRNYRKSLNITKLAKLRNSKIYKLHKVIMNRGL